MKLKKVAMGANFGHMAASWLAAYSAHSTILLAGAWLAHRWQLLHTNTSLELLWKFALLGGFITASLHTMLDASSFPHPGRELVQTQIMQQVLSQSLLEESQSSGDLVQAEGHFVATRSVLGEDPQPAHPNEKNIHPIILKLLAGGWLAGVIVKVTRLGSKLVALKRMLADRVEITSGPLHQSLDRIVRQAGLTHNVRLYTLPYGSAPFAVGRREIYLPEDMLDHDTAAVENILAHETAHLMRGDNLWQWLISILDCLVFFQPMNSLAHARIKELSEFQCDDWAAWWTGRPQLLARSLINLALAHSEKPDILPTMSIATEQRTVSRRVRRLLVPQTGAPPKAVKTGWMVAVAGSLVLFFLFISLIMSHATIFYSPQDTRTSILEGSFRLETVSASDADLGRKIELLWSSKVRQ
jgi:beta-lactamase regulating signal transducer with metallopeptidase domain